MKGTMITTYMGATRARKAGTHCIRELPLIDGEPLLYKLKPAETESAKSTTERLLELAIAADRGQPILRDLLKLAADIVEE